MRSLFDRGLNGVLTLEALVDRLELGVEWRLVLTVQRVAESIADAIECATEVCRQRPWKGEPVGSGAGVIGELEVFAHLGVGEAGLTEGGIGAFAVRADVEALAGRIVKVGAEFAFPEIFIHTAGKGNFLTLLRARLREFDNQVAQGCPRTYTLSQ